MRLNPLDRANAALRCKATSKRTGNRCRAPAVRGWKVCRYHGAGGGAPKGEAHGRYRHGRYTCEAIALRQETAELIAEARLMLVGMNCG